MSHLESSKKTLFLKACLSCRTQPSPRIQLIHSNNNNSYVLQLLDLGHLLYLIQVGHHHKVLLQLFMAGLDIVQSSSQAIGSTLNTTNFSLK